MDTHERETLKALIQELARLINAILSQSPDLRAAIQEIENKGYHVDIVLASMTSVMEKEPQEPLEVEATDFDKYFLKGLRIRPDGTSNP